MKFIEVERWIVGADEIWLKKAASECVDYNEGAHIPKGGCIEQVANMIRADSTRYTIARQLIEREIVKRWARL